MKTIQVINKKTNELLFRVESREEAEYEVLEYIENNNRHYNEGEEGYLYIFDFSLEEGEAPKEITSYEEAKRYTGNLNYDDVIDNLPENHRKAVGAMAKLLTLAKAWNQEDNFTPNFSDKEQERWFPSFNNDEGAITSETAIRICFSTRERAESFGNLFKDLYNDIL